MTADAVAPSPCLCESLRRAARATTRMYDEALRPVDLRLSQFSLLAALTRSDEARVRDLADSLVLEDSTLTRNLKPLVERGLLTVRPGTDRREKLVSLTTAGRTLLAKAAPLWRATQTQLHERLPGATWDTAFRVLPKITAAAS